MQRFLLIALTLLFANSLAALTVTGDITTDTTWTNNDSPITLDPDGASGGTIKVRNGATLTIDSSSGAVNINWNEDCDFQIGNGSGDAGDLVIKAASGNINFKLKTGGNVRINPYGSITFTSYVGNTNFTRNGVGEVWGALIFEAGQTKQSALKNCEFERCGNDGRDAAIVIENSSTVPTLDDIAFFNVTTSCIKMEGNGINVLKRGNVTLPLNVSGATYSFFLNAVVSTAEYIDFPDANAPNSPSVRVDGTCQIGGASNVSHWRFCDGYTFKCSASSKIQVINGSIWGTPESRPLFEASSGTSDTHWVGLSDDYTATAMPKANVFGDIGPFAYLEVRNAATGIDIHKDDNDGGTAYFVPYAGQQTRWRFPGLLVQQCYSGIYVRTHIDGSGNGYTTVFEDCTVGATTAGNDCDAACCTVAFGRVEFLNCAIQGAVNSGMVIGAGSAFANDVLIRDSKITDTSGTTGVLIASSQGSTSVRIERSIIEGWNTGIYSIEAAYASARSLTLSHTFVSALNGTTCIGINIQIQTASVCNLLVEDCNIAGASGGTTNVGVWLQEMRNETGASATFRRTTIDSNGDYGVLVGSDSDNTIDYLFDQCAITTNATGIYDNRSTGSAKTIVQYSTFAGNTTSNAVDAGGTQIYARYCYWGAATPSGTTNTDTASYFSLPYIGQLTGGSPASASMWDVWESSSVQADNLHVISNTPYLKWTFASDFGGQSQGSWEVDIDNDPDFGSLHYDGSEISNANAGFTYGGAALSDGVVYYARVRLEDANGRSGGWRYLTFRMNSAPGQVGNTNRTPSSGTSGEPPATRLQWERPADSDEDPLHFKVEIDDNSSFNNGTGKYRSLLTSQYLGSGGYAQVSYDSGTTWVAFPTDGVTIGGSATPRIRLYLPTTYPNGLGALIGGTWYWRVKATDSFEEGTASSNYTFSTTSGFTIEGEAPGSGFSQKQIKVARNGAVLSESAMSDGEYSITITSVALSAGDVLVAFVNGDSTKSATIVRFTGQDMDDASGLHMEVNISGGTVTVDHRTGAAFTNAAFATDSGADSDIPWSESSGNVTFTTAPALIEVRGSWSFTGDVDCDGNGGGGTTFKVSDSGCVETNGYDLFCDTLQNYGRFELLAGSVLSLDGGTVTNYGRMTILGSTVTATAGGNTPRFQLHDGQFDAKSSTFNGTSTNGRRLTVDSTGAGALARVSIVGCTFSYWSLTVETDGIIEAFDNNIFQSGISTTDSSSHIYWKATDTRTSTTMRGNQFDFALTQGSQFNVEATSGALNLVMIGCGGIRFGEGYDKNGGSEGDSLDNKVLWDLVPPGGVKALGGYVHNRIEWSIADQPDVSGFGFNVYQSRLKDGGKWTSAPSYAGGETTFTDSSASFTSYVSVNDEFYPKYISSTKLTVAAVTATTIRVTGDYSAAAASGDSYSFFVKKNASLLSGSTSNYLASSLTADRTYHYYVTVDDSTEDAAPSSRIRSVMVSARTITPSMELIPSSTAATSVLAMTLVGKGTHWDTVSPAADATVTKDGGSGVTKNDVIVLSPTLMLVDVTLSSATTGSWTVTAIKNNYWGEDACDESLPMTLTVNADSNGNRPTLSFTTNGGAIAADANTSGAFIIDLDFNANSGSAIDTTKFEFYANRVIQVDGFDDETADPGENVGYGAKSIFDGAGDTLDANGATANIEQEDDTDEELFSTGEYIVYARIGNSEGLYSEWVSRRFYVEGANASVAKTTTLLKQGDTNVAVTVTGSGLSSAQTIDFNAGGNSGITVNSATGSDTSITVYVTVDQLAPCGPRTFTTNNGSISGVIVVEYPTNILPTVPGTTEPSRNPAIGGVNVLLHTGAFFKSETDIATRGRMMGISWSRFYRSDITYNGPLGFNWVGHYYQRAIYDSGSGDIHWYTPDGRKEVFPDVTGGFSSPVGVYVAATRETTHNTITLTDRHGFACVFNSAGRLWKCVDRNGNATECTYNYAGQLTTITDDRNKTYEFTYADHGRVDIVKDKVWSTGSPREVEYEYNSSGDLIEQKAPKTDRYGGVSAPLPRITYGYVYDSAHRMTACVNPREFAQSGNTLPYLENQYDAGKVVAQRLGELDEWLYVRYVSGTSVRVIDRRGLRTDYTLDASGRATTVARYTKFWSVDTDLPITHSTVTEVSGKIRSSDPTSFNTVFTYNSNHEILTVTYPRGNKVTYAYPSGSSQTSGTATSCTDNKLLKMFAGWTNDAFIGMTLRMGTNPSNYKYYTIIDNDSNEIWVDSNFDLQDDGWNADAYNVFSQSGDPMAAGNVLTVTRSDEGLGSESDIITTYTYEPRYQFVKTVKNPRNYTTTYTYDYEDSEIKTDKFAGNLVKVSSPSVTLGQPSSQTITTRTTYNPYGQPVSSVDGEGNATVFTYYSGDGHDGFLKQSISAYGVLDLTSEFDYDNVGNLTLSWPPRAYESGSLNGDFVTYFYVNELDQTWHTTSSKLRESGTDRTDVYRYFDANGNVTHTFREYINDAGTEPTAPNTPSALDVSSFASEFDACTNHMAAGWVQSKSVYNLLNYPTEHTVDAIAGGTVSRLTSRTEYDANYNVAASVSPLGNRSATVYDERDMVFQSISGANSDVVGTFESDYDANGNLSKSRDALGNLTEYTYDGFDRTTIVKDPALNERKSYYDANSNVIKSEAYWGSATTGQLLARSESFFDEIDRVYKTQRMADNYLGTAIGDGYSTSTTLFDKNSRVVSSTDDNGVTFYRFYDAANRTTYTRDAVGNEAHFEYNLDGAVTRTTYREISSLDASVEVSHEETDYDRINRRIRFRDRRYNATSRDSEIEWKYDGWSRVTQTTDAAGVSTDHIYDLLSRSLRTTRKPSGTDSTWIVTDNTYDDDSRVVRRTIWEVGDDTTPTNPQDTDYLYDERSRLINLRRPDGDIWTYRYDANSNRLGWTDPLGTNVTDTYDNRNLVSYRMIERGTGVKGATYESYEHDALGRLTACSNYNGANLISSSSWRYNTLSKPEQLTQTIAKSDGTLFGTYTTGCEYDATGFNTAVIYSDGRRVTNRPDALNRLLETYDETNNVYIAAYLYAGPNRLVNRVYGNNIRTRYEYEASGCGCGGFSSGLCEKVEHYKSSDGEVLFSTERRFDTLANVAVEKRNDLGGMGYVYRYDDTYRLISTYYGVDLWEDAGNDNSLSQMASPENTPDVFGLSRSYALDTRGNRGNTGGTSGLHDTDDTTATVFDTDFTVSDDKRNLYTSIEGGGTFTYDVAEQMTYDPSTGTYYAYDYKGQLIFEDNSSGFSIPERRYSYDNQGRRKTEEIWYEASEHNQYNTVMIDAPNCESGCTCDGSTVNPLEEQTKNSAGSNLSTTQYSLGVGVTPPGSGSAQHPATASAPGGGSMAGNMIVASYEDTSTSSPFWRFMHESQLSVIGVTDSSGYRTHIYDYDPHGAVMHMPVLLDFQDSLCSDPEPYHTGDVTLVWTDTTLTANTLEGFEAYLSQPGAGADRGISARIVDNASSYIVLYDPDSAFYNALDGNLQGFVVLDFQDDNNVDLASGTWSTSVDPPAAEYISGTNRTRIHATASFFDGDEVGHFVCIDYTNDHEYYGYWLEVLAYGTDWAPWIEVAGNATGLYDSGSTTFKIKRLPYAAQSGTSTGGQWTSDPSNSWGATGVTTWIHAGADFNGTSSADFMPGCLLVPDVQKPAPQTITGTPSAIWLTTAGDGRGLGEEGTTFRVYTPPGVSAITGALCKPEDAGKAGTEDPGPRYLWCHYRYMPPNAGVYVDPPSTPPLGVWGMQGDSSTDGVGNGTRTNMLGSYYCWNRVYSPYLGRWTTPDPAASPWWNLWDYAQSSPAQLNDPLGLWTNWKQIRSEHYEEGVTPNYGPESKISTGVVILGKCFDVYRKIKRYYIYGYHLNTYERSRKRYATVYREVFRWVHRGFTKMEVNVGLFERLFPLAAAAKPQFAKVVDAGVELYGHYSTLESIVKLGLLSISFANTGLGIGRLLWGIFMFSLESLDPLALILGPATKTVHIPIYKKVRRMEATSYSYSEKDYKVEKDWYYDYNGVAHDAYTFKPSDQCCKDKLNASAWAKVENNPNLKKRRDEIFREGRGNNQGNVTEHADGSFTLE